MKRRIVIKIGTHILSNGEGLAFERIEEISEFLYELSLRYEVLVVSSGAVGAGYTRLNLDKSDIVNKQALAAIGQAYLISVYQHEFQKHDKLVAQVLLGASEFDSRKSTEHSLNAINRLIEQDVIPIINENDVTSIKELAFGDNDQLAAYVTHHFKADLLVLLSDIDGYYDKDPNKYNDASMIKNVYKVTKKELEASAVPGSAFGTGGIYTKLKAAKFLLSKKKSMFLASGFDLEGIKSYLIEHEHDKGTLFQKQTKN